MHTPGCSCLSLTSGRRLICFGCKLHDYFAHLLNIITTVKAEMTNNTYTRSVTSAPIDSFNDVVSKLIDTLNDKLDAQVKAVRNPLREKHAAALEQVIHDMVRQMETLFKGSSPVVQEEMGYAISRALRAGLYAF